MKQRFERLVDEHGGRLLQIACLMLRSRAEAEDVVQDCMVKLWRHLSELKPGAESGWLVTCTRNACLDQLRNRNRRRGFLQLVTGETDRLSHVDNPPQHEMETAERAQRLRTAIAEMPEPGRSLLILRDIQQIDVATVANTLSLTENQVKVYTFRARRTLRRRLEEETHAQVA